MQRSEVVQNILNLYTSPSYLEVGVQDGFTFHDIHAARKVAVDPAFRFDVNAAARDPKNAESVYCEVPSDEYFAGAGAGESFDVIYLDGLHTFDQTLRDLLNALGCLKPNGVILLDDTVPLSYGSSLPDENVSLQFRALKDPSQAAWMGDVYRLVFFIADYLPQLSYATIIENHGQTLVWREQRAAPLNPRSVEAISRIDYAEMVLNGPSFKFAPFAEVLALTKSRLSSLT